jgi:hypothetical protein
MDASKKAEPANRPLNWADMMDELLRENFENKVHAWSWRGADAAAPPAPERAGTPPRARPATEPA